MTCLIETGRFRFLRKKHHLALSHRLPPWVRTPTVSGKAGRNHQDITPCRIRTRCTMSFSVTGKGFWKLNFRIGGRKLQNPPESGVLNRGLCPEGLRPPILKFSFQVGDVWFCGFYPALPLNGGFWHYMYYIKLKFAIASLTTDKVQRCITTQK